MKVSFALLLTKNCSLTLLWCMG